MSYFCAEQTALSLLSVMKIEESLDTIGKHNG